MKTFHSLSCCDIKMRIMTSTFELEMTSSSFLNFTRFLPIVYSYQVSAWSELNQKKMWKICLFNHVFSQALLPLNGYHGNNEWPILKIFISKDDLCNGLKSHKVSWRSAEPVLRYLAKTLRGAILLPPPPVQIGLRPPGMILWMSKYYHHIHSAE